MPDELVAFIVFVALGSVSETSISASGSLSPVTVTSRYVALTVTAAVAFTDPDVTVIVADPFTTAVTCPAEETVATFASEVAQDMLAPDIVAPFWSLTVAESCCVAPKDEKLKVVAESVIEVATGVGGLVGVVPPSPHARSRSTAESRM